MSSQQKEARPSEPQAFEFPVTWLSEAKLSLDARPVIKGLIDNGSFVVVYGPSGSGKSFFTADIAQCIAMGAPWRGRKVQRGLVVYVASEAGASILRRFVGWRDRCLGDAAENIPLAILTRGPNLLDDIHIERLVAQLKELAEMAGLPLLLVVFDTLSRSMPGGDENNASDMTRVVAAADRIKAQLGAGTAYVHHSGKDPSKGARGHSALFAAADLVVSIQDRVATVEKVRDGISGERFPFSLEPIEIGTDADGEPVMTCLINASDAPSQGSRKLAIKGIAATSLKALREAIDSFGESLPESSTIPRGSRGVQVEQWRERFRLRYGDDADATVRAKAFWRAKEQLLSANAIAISDPWVWVQ